MGSKSTRDLPLSLTFLLVLLLFAGFATSDLAQDRAECADQLVGLAGCLPYVGGEAKAPTIDCCTGLKQVLDKSKKCVCILIKDRDDPNLGFKINATLAIHLPSTCHTPANLTECVNLLHLKPNSPEAKVFEGFEKAAETNNSTTPATSANATATAARRAATSAAGNGGWGKRWLAVEVVWGILPFVLTSHMFFLV